MADNYDKKALMIIANAGFSDEIIQLARKAGATGATILNARGEGAIYKSFLGISVDSEKEMIIILVPDFVADKIMEDVKENAGINSPAHAVCFTLPVEKMTETKRDVTDIELDSDFVDNPTNITGLPKDSRK